MGLPAARSDTSDSGAVVETMASVYRLHTIRKGHCLSSIKTALARLSVPRDFLTIALIIRSAFHSSFFLVCCFLWIPNPSLKLPG